MIRFVPNILTMLRLVLSLVFLGMVLYMPKLQASPERSCFIDWAFVLFVVAGLTDIVDGKIARKYNASSKFGRILDPLVDKVLVCGAFVCFAIIGQPKLFDISGWALTAIHWGVAAVIIAREVTITILRQIAESRGINFAAMPAGKLKMFVQSFTIGTILVKMSHVPDAAWGNWITILALIASAAITVFSALPAATHFVKSSKSQI